MIYKHILVRTLYFSLILYSYLTGHFLSLSYYIHVVTSFLCHVSAPQRIIHILHNSEQPATCFAVLDTGTVLVSDLLFELLMAKLTSTKAGRDAFYQQRKGFKIESRGQRYELGDFIIKIGSVSLVSNFKGILVEVRI